MSKSSSRRNKYLTSVSAFLAATACKGDSMFTSLTGSQQANDGSNGQQVQKLLEVPADVMSSSGFETLMENLNDPRFYDVVLQSERAPASVKQLAAMSRDGTMRQKSDNVVNAMRLAVRAKGNAGPAALKSAATQLSQHLQSKYPAVLEYLKAYTKANPLMPNKVQEAQTFLQRGLMGGHGNDNGVALTDSLELQAASRFFGACMRQFTVNCAVLVNVAAVASVYTEVSTSGSRIAPIAGAMYTDDSED